MTLDAYFARPDAKSITDVARLAGVSKGRISQIRGGDPCPAALALEIEAATDGLVNASDLSPVIAKARAA